MEPRKGRHSSRRIDRLLGAARAKFLASGQPVLYGSLQNATAQAGRKWVGGPSTMAKLELGSLVHLSLESSVLRKVLRYLTYPVLVGIIVAAVWYSIVNFPADKPRASGGVYGNQQVPKEAWKPSSKFDAEANAGFTVDTAQKDNAPLAGKSVGADWPQFNGPHRDNKSLEKDLS